MADSHVPLRQRLDRALLVLAITLGTLPIALFGSAAAARFLPLSDDARFATAFALAIPLWVAAMLVALLAKSGSRALGVCIGVSCALAALVLGVGP
jgi:hypothetical protein